MKELVKSLLGMGITAGLADREKFVEKVSSVIEQYQEDPEKAEKWASAIVAYLERTNDGFFLQRTIKAAVNNSDLAAKEDIEKLTEAIQALTAEMQKKKS